jgi:NitT/TauT family transport system permease protein
VTATTVTQISPLAAASTSRRRVLGILRALAPPILFGVAFLALWQWFVTARDIAPYVLPAPSNIWAAFWDDHALIVGAAESTGANALVGLVAGTVLAVLAAAVAVRLRIADEMITPLAAAAATMPIVALAPIFNNMFSLTSTLPRRMVVVVTVFVPIFMNVARGLKRIAPVHAELMSSYAASGAAVLRTVRIPGALPYFFVGLRIAASLSVISAVVAEYFGGLQRGLGPRITSAVAASDYASAWAFVLGAIVLGLLFYLVALTVERIALRNHA